MPYHAPLPSFRESVVFATSFFMAYLLGSAVHEIVNLQETQRRLQNQLYAVQTSQVILESNLEPKEVESQDIDT